MPTCSAKKQLIRLVNRETGAGMDENILTIGFARRATTYKRVDLLFRDLERLKRISNEVGKIQIIYGGKAHPGTMRERSSSSGSFGQSMNFNTISRWRIWKTPI